LVRARSARHWPEPNRLDIDPGPLHSTSARTWETWHWPGLVRLNIGPGPFDLTATRACSARHWPDPSGSTSTRARRIDISPGYSARYRPGPARLDNSSGALGLKSTRARSAQYGFETVRLDIDPGPLGSTSTRARSARHRLDFLGLTWIGPSQNLSQNAIWIIQKCIQSISNPYPIKWIWFKIQKYEFGFEINPFKWIKTNMDMDNYELDFVVWIFCPPLDTNIRVETAWEIFKILISKI